MVQAVAYDKSGSSPIPRSEGFPLEFGFSLPGRGPLAKPDLVLKLALKAEALRYASVFVTDHVVLPASAARSVYPYAPTGQFPGGAQQDYLEPLTMLAWL